MKKYVLTTILFLLFSPLVFSQGMLILQDKAFIIEQKRDLVIWKRLMEEPGFAKLDSVSKEFFYWTNIFRNRPIIFYRNVIVEFIQQFPEANTPDFKSLESDIRLSSDSLSLLFPDEGLSKMATDHCKDLIKRGSIISHVSARGKGFSDRLNSFGNYYCGAENIYTGSNDPLKALILLLIDNGVKDKGHRKNLLNPDFGIMGVAYITPANGKSVLVQEIACK